MENQKCLTNYNTSQGHTALGQVIVFTFCFLNFFVIFSMCLGSLSCCSHRAPWHWESSFHLIFGHTNLLYTFWECADMQPCISAPPPPYFTLSTVQSLWKSWSGLHQPWWTPSDPNKCILLFVHCAWRHSSRTGTMPSVIGLFLYCISVPVYVQHPTDAFIILFFFKSYNLVSYMFRHFLTMWSPGAVEAGQNWEG